MADVLNSTIKTIGLFRTPESWKEIEDWIERHPAEERIHLMTAAAMAWNLAAAVSQSHLTEIKEKMEDLATMPVSDEEVARFNARATGEGK